VTQMAMKLNRNGLLIFTMKNMKIMKKAGLKSRGCG